MSLRRAARRLTQGPPPDVEVEPPTPEDALEPALHVVLEASGAVAGAVCLFDPEAGLLRLVVEIGLSEEGCHRLRTLRRQAGCWERPLDSLDEGRPLIDRTSDGGKIVPLVEPAGSIGAVACIPLYSAGWALGCVILASTTPDSFTEALLEGLAPSLAALAQTVEGASRPVVNVVSQPDFTDEVRRVHIETEHLRSAEGAVRAEREQLEQALADAQAMILQTEVAQTEDLRQAHELARSAEEARAGAMAELEAIRAALATAQRKLLEAEAELHGVGAEMERLKALAVAGPGGAPAAGQARPAVRAKRIIAVLDADGAVWEAIGNVEVAVVAPGSDVASRLDALGPARIIVNLAAPDALTALAALQASGSPGRWWGCMAAPDASRALLLGMVELADHPFDPDTLLARLRAYSTVKRVLCAGNDAASFLSLRHTLTRAGMSVSTAWDAKQATDLLEMVRADAVIVDLGLKPRGGYEIVALLAAMNPPPVTVLIPGEDDPTRAFLAALSQHLRPAYAHSRRRLLEELLGRSNDAGLSVELRK